MIKPAPRSYKSGMSLEKTTQAAMLFEDLISPQDSYDKDKKGRKRPERMREGYCSTKEKVSKQDLEQLKASLENAGTACHLIGILENTNCEPYEFAANDLPSRQRIIKAGEVSDKLDQTAVRTNTLKNLTRKLDCTSVPENESCKNILWTSCLLITRDAERLRRTHGSKMSVKSGINRENVV